MLVKDAAKLLAEDTLEKYWDFKEYGYPIDPVYIAGKMGIEVYAESLPDDVSGVLKSEPGKNVFISLEETDKYERQMFTCAHELGHYIERVTIAEDCDENYEFIDRRTPKDTGKLDLREFFADEFASCLLMPEREFREFFKKYKEPKTEMAKLLFPYEEIANHFGVSITAAKVKASKLELNKWS